MLTRLHPVDNFGYVQGISHSFPERRCLRSRIARINAIVHSGSLAEDVMAYHLGVFKRPHAPAPNPTFYHQHFKDAFEVGYMGLKLATATTLLADPGGHKHVDFIDQMMAYYLEADQKKHFESIAAALPEFKESLFAYIGLLNTLCHNMGDAQAGPVLAKAMDKAKMLAAQVPTYVDYIREQEFDQWPLSSYLTIAEENIVRGFGGGGWGGGGWAEAEEEEEAEAEEEEEAEAEEEEKV